MRFGWLSSRELATARDWFDKPIQNIPVKVVGGYEGGGDGACRVELPNGSIAYMKPRDGGKHLVPVREKIASDLAALIGVPVAPVLIMPPDNDNARPHIVALSLVCLPSGRVWSQGGAGHQAVFDDQMAGLYAFWTWIGDNDHGGHGENLLYQLDGRPQLAAIDHSFCLCHNCAGNPLAVAAGTKYGIGDQAAWDASLERNVAAIQALDWSAVEGIVHRLSPVLTADERNIIVNILLRRREALPGMLGL